MNDLIIKAAKVSKKQNRTMFIYAVAYRGLIISAIRPPCVQNHVEVSPDGHFFEIIQSNRQHKGHVI